MSIVSLGGCALTSTALTLPTALDETSAAEAVFCAWRLESVTKQVQIRGARKTFEKRRIKDSPGLRTLAVILLSVMLAGQMSSRHIHEGGVVPSCFPPFRKSRR